jgi:hypothetical protein
MPFYLTNVLPSAQAVYWLPTLCIARHIQCCCTLLRIHLQYPLIGVLVNLFCDVFVVLIHAYVFDECQHLHADTVLLRVLLMAFLLRSYFFAASTLKTTWIILYSPLSGLQALSRRCVVQIRHLSNPRMTVPVPLITSLLPMYTCSSENYISKRDTIKKKEDSYMPRAAMALKTKLFILNRVPPQFPH